jgi:hypothetical protein
VPSHNTRRTGFRLSGAMSCGPGPSRVSVRTEFYFWLSIICSNEVTGNDKKRVFELNLYDVDAVEPAEASLDAFILKRSRGRDKANALEEMWRASERRHRRTVRLANGHAWVEYFDHLALCHERRAGEYRDRSREVSTLVEALVDEGEGGES